MSEELGGQALDDRAEQQGGEEGERARRSRSRRSAGRRTSGVSVRNVPGPAGATRLPASEPATASAASSGTKRPTSIARPPSRSANVMPSAGVAGRVGLDEARVAGERRAVVVGLRDVGVERLREALRARVEDRRRARTWWRSRARWRPAPTSGTNSVPISDQLDLARLDLLAEVLGRAADHQAGDEHRQQDEQQHPVQARADAAEDHLAGHHVDQRHEAADAGVATRARS